MKIKQLKYSQPRLILPPIIRWLHLILNFQSDTPYLTPYVKKKKKPLNLKLRRKIYIAVCKDSYKVCAVVLTEWENENDSQNQ